MALEPNGRAPYTSANALITVLDAYRDKGLGVPITAETLVRAGVQESISKRTFLSMVELELIDPEGRPTPIFEAFRQTRGDQEYRSRLQEWLRDVYGDVLQYGDPSEDVLDRIQEAFRGYEPDGQRRAMAALFIGLWRYAGLPIVANESGQGSSGSHSSVQRPRRQQARPPKLRKAAEVKKEATEFMTQPSVLFGITNEDIGSLTEDEFQEVWAALGKVARARARHRPAESEISPEQEDES